MLAWFNGLSIAGKIGVAVGALVAVLLAAAGLVHAVNSHDEAMKDAGRAEVQAKWDAEKAGEAKVLAAFTSGLAASLQPKFDQLAGDIGRIDTTAAQINVKLPQAMARDPRYASADCALTPDVLTELNAARALSRPLTPYTEGK